MRYISLYRCPDKDCTKQWYVYYTTIELLTNFCGVMRALADVECEIANHMADEVNARVEEVLNG